jgi:hypothetical protein
LPSDGNFKSEVSLFKKVAELALGAHYKEKVDRRDLEILKSFQKALGRSDGPALGESCNGSRLLF